MIRAYAESGGPSTTRTADDRAYTAWAAGQAAGAGVRNPRAYVERNVRANAGPASRNRVMGQLNRGGNR